MHSYTACIIIMVMNWMILSYYQDNYQNDYQDNYQVDYQDNYQDDEKSHLKLLLLWMKLSATGDTPKHIEHQNLVMMMLLLIVSEEEEDV